MESAKNNLTMVDEYQDAVIKLGWRLENERKRVCHEAKTKYIPNGLLTSIPEHWNCSFSESE